MIIKNSKGDKFIETTDEAVIFHKNHTEIKIAKSKITAAHLCENYMLEILCENKVKKINLKDIKGEDKVLLPELLEELDMGEVIFGYTTHGDSRTMIFCLMIAGVTQGLLSSNYILTIMFLILGGFIAQSMIKYPTFEIFTYNIDKELATFRSSISKVNKEVSITDGEFSAILDKNEQCLVKINSSKSILLKSRILYPTECNSIVDKLIGVCIK